MAFKKKSRAVTDFEKVLAGMRNLKAHYDNLDPATKKKVVTGLAGAAALLLGARAVSKARKKKRDSQE